MNSYYWLADTDYYYYLDYGPKRSYCKRKPDYSDLIRQLSSMREGMCGIGTNRLKRFLNKKIKEGDKVAEIFSTALNLEDANIRAKKYSGSTYSDHYYDEKEKLLKELIGLCCEKGNILFGYQYTDDDFAYINAVMYFNLPGCEQVSFHCHLETADANTLPKFPNEWDGQKNSTLPKLEKAILAQYGEEIAGLKKKILK